MDNPKNKKKLDFFFKKEVSYPHLEWGLVKYYNSLPQDQVREMLLQAASGFWEAIVTEMNTESSEKAQKKALDCIYVLRYQIKKISTQFQISSNVEQKPNLSFPFLAKEPVKFEFRYQVKTDVGPGELVQFLKQEYSPFSGELKVLYPSVCYWSSFAWASENLWTDESQVPEQTRQNLANNIAVQCIHRLNQHIDFLEDRFNLKQNQQTLSTDTEMLRQWQLLVHGHANQVITPLESLNGNSLATEEYLGLVEENHPPQPTSLEDDEDDDGSWLLSEGPLDQAGLYLYDNHRCYSRDDHN